MARLIVPTVAYRLLTDGVHQDRVWHLLPPRRGHRADELLTTVCNQALWPTTPQHWYTGSSPVYRREMIAITDLQPQDLCRQCLGAMQSQAEPQKKKRPVAQPQLLV